MQKIDFLKYQIDQHKVFFFDVFDTLIKRIVPEGKDVFRLVEMRYDRKFNTKCHFFAKRVAAEKEARKNGKYREVNLDEIYSFFDGDSENANINVFKRMELEAEFDVCVANQPLYKIFQYCLTQHKRIYIVSDMYLSAQQIAKLLQVNGYNGYCRIYSSCDFRLTKWESGKLFKKIISEENLNHSEILHIGNDKVADFNKAKQQGIDAFLVTEVLNHGKHYQSFIDDFNYQCMELFIGNTLMSQENYFYQLGFEIFGPILYGFTKWLLQQCEQLNLKKIFFFSRDGYLLKKSFDLMQTDIDTTYFYVSRKAVIVPLLQFDSSFEEILGHYKSWDKTFTWKYVFDRFNIPKDLYEPILEDLRINPQTKITLPNLFESKDTKTIFKKLTPFLETKSTEQLRLLKKYMIKENLCGTLGIVDMGAGCSIEFALNKLLKHLDISITPYYLYVHSALKETNIRKKYLNSGSGNRQINAMLRFCYMFLEIILAAPHGSVSGYTEESGQVYPVLENNEYEISFRNATEDQYIEILQKGALDFVQQFQQRLGKYMDLGERDVLIGFKNFGITPLPDDIQIWGDFQILLDRYTKLITSSSHSYFLHPFNFFKDMCNNIWPSGFFMKHTSCQTAMKFLFNIYLMSKYR